MFFWVAVTWGACFGLWLDRGAQIFLSIRWHASWAQLGLSMSKTVDYSDLILPEPPALSDPVPQGLRYIIATSMRSGSTLLTDALASTGVAGTPDEHFVAGQVGAQAQRVRYGVDDDADFIDQLIKGTASANGVFGTKMFWGFWDRLIPCLLAKTGRELDRPMQELLPILMSEGLGKPLKYIWLRRRNKVAQAISLYRARNTGQWRAYTWQGGPDEARHKELEFDEAKIRALVEDLEEQDRKWLAYFQLYRIGPLMIFYEDFAEAYEGTVRGVMKFLDLPSEDVAIPPPKLERQADERSKEWERRFYCSND